MSMNEFDRAVNFLQNALNVAVLKAKVDPRATLNPASNEQPVAIDPHADEPCLPGFEPPPAPVPEPPPAEPSVESDSIASLSDKQAGTPPLNPANDSQSDGPSGTSACPSANGLRVGRLAASALLAVCTGVAVVAAHKLIRPRTVVQVVEKEIQVEPDGIPLALLPETAEADVWEIVANMSGEINGTLVSFKRGSAQADGNDYRVCLDFCRSGNDIYAKVDGNGCWVVNVAPNGQIQKAYRAQKGGKPLRTLFAK